VKNTLFFIPILAYLLTAMKVLILLPLVLFTLKVKAQVYTLPNGINFIKYVAFDMSTGTRVNDYWAVLTEVQTGVYMWAFTADSDFAHLSNSYDGLPMQLTAGNYVVYAPDQTWQINEWSPTPPQHATGRRFRPGIIQFVGGDEYNQDLGYATVAVLGENTNPNTISELRKMGRPRFVRRHQETKKWSIGIGQILPASIYAILSIGYLGFSTKFKRGWTKKSITLNTLLVISIMFFVLVAITIAIM